MEERIYTLYMHTCNANNKKYIGITMVEPKKRWNNGHGYKNQLFYSAIKKYGWENFEHEVILENLTQEEANTLEIEMIKHYRATERKYGYNQDGGGSSTGGRPDYIKNTISKTMKNKNINVGNKNPMYGKHGADNATSKPIICIESNKVYESIADASKELGIIFQNISKVCKKERHTAGGFHWMFYDEYLETGFNSELKYHKSKKKVYCINNETIYDTAKEASIELNIGSSSIGQCCRKEITNTHGLIFVFYEDWLKDNNPDNYVRCRKYHVRPVLNIDLNIYYKSATEAATENNIRKSHIYEVCRNKRKTAGGYHWEYVDKDTK